MNNLSRPTLLADYPALFTLPIQWGDQDLFGHVNNTVYLRWFESARIVYLEQSGLDPLLTRHGLGPILANLKCDYRRQLKYPDTVTVSARITRLGRSSLTMQHAVFSHAQQQIAAEGESILVAFDYKNQQSVAIPDDVRAQIAKFEGKSE
jgi:acyl-CoA thioester hydrolase